MSFAAGVYTVTLGGGALLAGVAASTTLTVPGAAVGMHVIVTPQTDPGIGCVWYGFVSSTNTVTVRILAVIALTPTSTVFNVSVQS